MEKKTTGRWQLQDILHAVGEESISTSEYDNPNGEVNLAKVEPRDSGLVGKITELDIANRKGLPACLSGTEKMHIFLSIRKDTRGMNPCLLYTSDAADE